MKLSLSFILWASLIFVSCESFRTVYVNEAIVGQEIRLLRYYDGCCGFRANVIDIKISDTVEYRYFLHCDGYSYSSGLVQKQKILTNGNKVTSITNYKSSEYNIQQELEIPLSKLDSLALIKIPATVNLDFTQNCDSANYLLKRISGFIETGEYTNPKNVKSHFRKKAKLGKVRYK